MSKEDPLEIKKGDIVKVRNTWSSNELKSRRYKVLKINKSKKNEFLPYASLEWIDCPPDRPRSRFYYSEIIYLIQDFLTE